jgi:hypothetical protein
MESGFNFENKEAARKFFQGLRQIFIEWNSSEWQSKGFSKKEQEIKERVAKVTL